MVAVDERGRLTIPKELQVRSISVTVIPAGPFFIIIPIPNRPLESSSKWLDTHRTRKDLKTLAERAARQDAVRRTKRRKQI